MFMKYAQFWHDVRFASVLIVKIHSWIQQNYWIMRFSYTLKPIYTVYTFTIGISTKVNCGICFKFQPKPFYTSARTRFLSQFMELLIGKMHSNEKSTKNIIEI